MNNPKGNFNIDIGAMAPAMAGVFNKVVDGAKRAAKSASKAMGRLKSSVSGVEKTGTKAGKNVSKAVDGVGESSKKAKENMDGMRKGFPAWALSVMFAGMIIQRVFQNIAQSGVQAFDRIMRSQDHTKSNFEYFRNTMTKMWFGVGQALEPLWKALIPIVDKIAEFVQNNPKIVRLTVIIGFLLGLLLMVWGSLGLIIFAFKKIAAFAIWAKMAAWIGVAIKAVITFISLTVGWTVVIVAAIAIAVYLIIKYWDEVWAFIKWVFGHIVDAAKWAWDKVVEGVKWFWGWIKTIFKAIGNAIVWVGTKIWDALKWAFEKVWSGIKWLYNKFLDFRMWLINTFISIGEGIYNGLISGIELAINGAIGLINKFIRGVNSKLGGWGINIGEVSEVSLGRADFGRVERAGAGELGADTITGAGGATNIQNDNRDIDINIEMHDRDEFEAVYEEYLAER